MARACRSRWWGEPWAHNCDEGWGLILKGVARPRGGQTISWERSEWETVPVSERIKTLSEITGTFTAADTKVYLANWYRRLRASQYPVSDSAQPFCFKIFIYLAVLGLGRGTWVLFIATCRTFHCGQCAAASCSAVCGILVPRSGIDLMSPASQDRFLTTGPPGTFPKESFWTINCIRKEGGIFKVDHLLLVFYCSLLSICILEVIGLLWKPYQSALLAISYQPHIQRCHVRRWKPALVRVCAPQKVAKHLILC